MAYDRDMREEFAEFYTAEIDRIDIVDAPELGCIAVTGSGSITGDDFQQASEAVIAVARAARQIVLERFGFTHVVPPLEALWAPGEGGDELSWMVLIPQPDWVDAAIVREARRRVDLLEQWSDLLSRITYEVLSERSCVQTLHVGSLAGLDSLHRSLIEVSIPGRGLQPSGMRHEIYLTNPKTTEPAEMRTILRQPVRTTVPARAPRASADAAPPVASAQR